MPCCYTWRHGVEVLFSIERALWMAAVLAEALVLVRLFREGLVRRYPFFTAFLVALVIGSVVLMQTDIKSRGYAQAYRICELILFVFRLGVAAELYEQICKHFPGIGVFRAGMAGVLILLAGLLAVFTFRPNLVHQWAFPQTIVMVILRFQGEIFSGAFLLTWIFLRFVLSIRQPFRPNVLTHWTIATIYFGASGAAYLAALLAGWRNGRPPHQLRDAGSGYRLLCGMVSPHAPFRRGASRFPAAFARSSGSRGALQPHIVRNRYVVTRRNLGPASRKSRHSFTSRAATLTPAACLQPSHRK